MLTLGKVQIVTSLDKQGLALVNIDQKTYRGKHNSDVTVRGYSSSNRRIISKSFRIMSVNPDVICRVISRNWY